MSDRTFLEEITIRSIGVIDQSTVELSKGLTVLSGETGAGKTMILTALNLILGGKPDSALVRKGSERLIASGRFSVPDSLTCVFEDSLIEDGQIIITRTVNVDGKSKASINAIAASASSLSAIGTQLVEIHAQAANQNIVKSSRQRELVDRFGSVDVGDYQKALEIYNEMKKRIASLESKIAEKDRELAGLRDFIQAFKKVNPKVNELDEIEMEISRLSSVEEFRVATSMAITALDDEESGSLTSIGVARRALDASRSKDPALEAIFAQISESFFLLDDAQSALNSYISNLEANPDRLDHLQTRKAQIKSLLKLYAQGDPTDDVISQLQLRFENSQDAIADLEGGDERLTLLTSELVHMRKNLIKAAENLTQLRISAAAKLSTLVTKEIQQLSMPHASFLAQVIPSDYSNVSDSQFFAYGCDEITMYIQSHKDAPLIALAKGASGGEMSRVMLALEVVIAASHPIGTYVFDEVDAGVGGKAAIEVGKRLHLLAQHAQVIVVTHLPQVAAWADSHFVVSKSDDGTVSQSGVRQVEGEERIQEIARMLAGFENSASAREHATELLALKV